jgi:hypothetical protein
MMDDRTGQVWLDEFDRETRIVLVLGPPKQGGVAESRTNPAPILMLHPCLDLTTGKRISGREWTDERWEGWRTRLA